MRYPLQLRYLTILFLLLVSITTMTVSAQDAEDEGDFDLPLTESITFTLRSNDTIEGLGALFDVQVDCLYTSNELGPADILSPGDTLFIDVECPNYDGELDVPFPRLSAAADEDVEPASTPDEEPMAVEDDDSEAMSTPATTQNDAGGDGEGIAIPRSPVTTDMTYTVEYGDTLDTIGQALNVSVAAIVVANEIENPGLIFPGDDLLIPGGAPAYGFFPALESIERGGFSGATYVAQPRDTLDEIAQAYNVSVVSLLLANDLAYGRNLKAGDSLIIPADAPPYGQFPALDTEARGSMLESVSGDVYVLQPQETVDGVSARFNVAPRCVLEANEIGNARLLTPGTSLVIQANCPPYDGYDVVPQS